ncbi:hypothetical protein DHEL01_v208524 [Diaporthe helianthi]|uniref:HypA protein n=1 Tax=Diaporthe helianthi TaxID=158607 RepID=A0A2P5HS72_DIAHE|nr:hypothetical protein DHEL01_v208524 [Diaporthe helianthi]
MSEASRISMSADHLGYIKGGPSVTAESLDITNRLLQKNHDELHIFFRDMNGHNHLVHNLFTRLSLGATPDQLQTAYDDDAPLQREIPPLDEKVVERLANDDYFAERITKITHYNNFRVFFEQQIDKKGWQQVVNDYVFSKSPIAEAILPLMYDGAYHPIIHLGLGAEFAQPAVIAEALAQAAAHDSFDTNWFFHISEKLAQHNADDAGGKPLLQLAREAAAHPGIREAARTPDLIGTMKQKRAIYPKAGDKIVTLAAQFRVRPGDFKAKTAEMIDFCAFLAGAAQRPGKATKIDFFFMHCVTSSLFISVLVDQDWISTEDKVRLVEWKGRLDLVWYITCGLPDLHAESITGYNVGAERDWDQLYNLVNEQHDDGHVAKFVRALKNGQDLERKLGGDFAPAVHGDMWLKIARMAYDTTLDLPAPAKWVLMAGMDSAWASVPNHA